VATRDAGIAAHLDRLRRELTETAAAVASLQALLTRAPHEMTVSYREAPAQLCVVLAQAVEGSEITLWCAQAYPRLYATAGRLGATVVGPGGALYDSTWFERGGGRVTSFVPVAAPVEGVEAGMTDAGLADADADAAAPPAGDEVRLATSPAQPLAVVLHSGAFQDLDRTYSALGRHVIENRIGAPGPIREIYLITPADTTDQSGLRTEVCWPVGHSPAVDTSVSTSNLESR
jgi:hypothetical protein